MRMLYAVLIGGIGLCGMGCERRNERNSAPEKHVTEAKAVLTPTKDSNTRGVVTFTTVEGGTRIIADITGLTPGRHGFHIHEKGDCSAPDASSAGSHFNPTHMNHGSPDNDDRHIGDLGNIEADSTGHAHYDRIDYVITLNGETSVVGRSVIVHTDADDFKTQPTGNAGGRACCGVIVATE